MFATPPGMVAFTVLLGTPHDQLRASFHSVGVATSVPCHCVSLITNVEVAETAHPPEVTVFVTV